MTVADLGLDWTERLQRTPTRTPRPVLANALVALREAPEWHGVLAYDDFALVTMAVSPPPWVHGHNKVWVLRQWSDQDDTLATEWLHQRQIFVVPGIISRAVEAVAKEARFHPIAEPSLVQRLHFTQPTSQSP
jgi:hypothetical protein